MWLKLFREFAVGKLPMMAATVALGQEFCQERQRRIGLQSVMLRICVIVAACEPMNLAHMIMVARPLRETLCSSSFACEKRKSSHDTFSSSMTSNLYFLYSKSATWYISTFV